MLLTRNPKGYILRNILHDVPFLHNIKSFRYKIGIQFNKGVLVAEQNNCNSISTPFLLEGQLSVQNIEKGGSEEK